MNSSFWDGSNENVVGHKLLSVISKELLVKLKSSALFPSNIEVFHTFTSFVEINWIFDADDSRIEWSGDVFSNLRLGVKKNSRLFFKGDGNFS
jgi:poly(A) polymerase Pap1